MGEMKRDREREEIETGMRRQTKYGLRFSVNAQVLGSLAELAVFLVSPRLPFMSCGDAQRPLVVEKWN